MIKLIQKKKNKQHKQFLEYNASILIHTHQIFVNSAQMLHILTVSEQCHSETSESAHKRKIRISRYIIYVMHMLTTVSI